MSAPTTTASDTKQQTVMDNILSELAKIQQQNNSIVTQNSNILSQNTEIKSDLATLKLNFDSLSTELSNCKRDINSLKITCDFQSVQFENHKKQQDNIILANSKINDEIALLNRHIKSLEKRLREEKIIRNNNENNNRKINLGISGIPVLSEENLYETITKIGDLIGIPNCRDTIDVAHRLFTKSTTAIPSIIVRFKCRTDRDIFFSKRSNLKNVTIADLGFTPTPATKKMFDKIYVNESLSAMSKGILRSCRERIKLAGFQSTFVSGGAVYVKKSESTKRIKINTSEDIDRVLKVSEAICEADASSELVTS